jgi:hypothetical protein
LISLDNWKGTVFNRAEKRDGNPAVSTAEVQRGIQRASGGPSLIPVSWSREAALPDFGKLLILVGAVFVLAGLLLTFGDRISFWRFGRLPGDIVYRRGNFTFYFPLVTSIVISVILTLVFWLFSRR